MSGTDLDMGILDGFADEEETAAVLTHPLVGYYHRNDGKIGSYHVWHERLRLKKANVERASFPVFERLGLIDVHTKIHSALVMPQTEFVVCLPPTLAPELERVFASVARSCMAPSGGAEGGVKA